MHLVLHISNENPPRETIQPTMCCHAQQEPLTAKTNLHVGVVQLAVRLVHLLHEVEEDPEVRPLVERPERRRSRRLLCLEVLLTQESAEKKPTKRGKDAAEYTEYGFGPPLGEKKVVL